MLKFLFGGRKTPQVKIETQRETFLRLVRELNAAIDALPDKPRVTIEPVTGHILPETPKAFPDEALALPSPGAGDRAPKAPIAPGTPDTPAGQAAIQTEPDAHGRKGHVAPVLPGTPVPNPPKASPPDRERLEAQASAQEDAKKRQEP